MDDAQKNEKHAVGNADPLKRLVMCLLPLLKFIGLVLKDVAIGAGQAILTLLLSPFVIFWFIFIEIPWDVWLKRVWDEANR